MNLKFLLLIDQLSFKFSPAVKNLIFLESHIWLSHNVNNKSQRVTKHQSYESNNEPGTMTSEVH